MSLFYTLLHPPASTLPSPPLLILDEQLRRPYLSYFPLTSSMPPSLLVALTQLNSVSLTSLFNCYRCPVPSLPFRAQRCPRATYPPPHFTLSSQPAPSGLASAVPTASSRDILIVMAASGLFGGLFLAKFDAADSLPLAKT